MIKKQQGNVTAIVVMVSLVVAVAFAGFMFMSGQKVEKSTLPINALLGGEFELPSTLERPLKLSELKGKVVLLNFGYTTCPDICPMVLARLTHVLKLLPESEVEQVQTLFVTFDPERDTVPHLQKYLEFFHPSMIGMTGELSEIEKVGKQYGVVFIKQDVNTDAGYLYAHSDYVYLLDKQGRIRKLYSKDDSNEDMVADIRGLLVE